MQDKNTSIKDTRRADLLNAASELLALTPTASLAEIADYAKIGKATLHRYFASRDELMLELGYRGLEMIAQAIANSELEQGQVVAALTRLIDALVPLGDKLHFLLNEPILDNHPDFVAADTITQAPLLQLIQRGQANGELRADLPPEWIIHQMNYMLFATWTSVYQGFIARRDAPRLLVATLLGGIATR